MSLQTIIEEAFENRDTLSVSSAPAEVKEAVTEALNLLDSGQARVAEKKDGDWVVNQWLKKAVLLSFRLNDNKVINTKYCECHSSKRVSLLCHW